MKYASALVLWGLVGCAARPLDPAQLVQSLAGPEGVQAFSVLMGNRDPSVMQAVGQGLQHPSARVRSQCVRLVAQQKDITWVPELSKLLKDPDRSVRTAAGRCLVSLLDTAECVALMRDDSLAQETRILLLDGLLRDPLELCEPELVEWLQSLPLDSFLTQVQKSLLRHWSPRLIKRQKDGELAEQLRQSTAALGQRALKLWQSRAESPLRLESLRLYASYCGEESVPTLNRILKDDTDPWTAACATSALGWSRSPEALGRIAAYLQGPALRAPEHRRIVLKGLGPLPESADRNRLLLQLVAGETPDNRTLIACLLSDTRDKSILPSLQRWLDSERHEPTRCTLQNTIATISGQCQPCRPCEPAH